MKENISDYYHFRKWSRSRAEMTDDDFGIVKALYEVCPEATQIFVTGEVQDKLLGEIASVALMKANAELKDPLFVLTEQAATWRQVRHIMYCINLLSQNWREHLLKREALRMGFTEWIADADDFYAGLFTANNLWGKRYSKDMYTTAMLLFGKDTFQDKRHTQHFAAGNGFDTRCFFSLSAEEEKQRQAVWDKEARYLTHKELAFLYELAGLQIVRF